MNAPLKRYPLLALVREDNLSLPSYRTDSFSLGFPKLASFKVTPFLKFLTVPNWSNVKISLLPNKSKSQNFEYVNPIGFYLCNILPLLSPV